VGAEGSRAPSPTRGLLDLPSELLTAILTAALTASAERRRIDPTTRPDHGFQGGWVPPGAAPPTHVRVDRHAWAEAGAGAAATCRRLSAAAFAAVQVLVVEPHDGHTPPPWCPRP